MSPRNTLQHLEKGDISMKLVGYKFTRKREGGEWAPRDQTRGTVIITIIKYT